MKNKLLTGIINSILENFKNTNGTIFHINHFKLQKLAFFCHANFLVKNDTPSPFTTDELFEAWENGPVLPAIYSEFKDHRPSTKLTRLAEFDGDNNNDYVLNKSSMYFPIIEEVLISYADYSSSMLIEISHTKGSPWEEVRSRTEDRNPKIEDSIIKSYYSTPKTALLR